MHTDAFINAVATMDVHRIYHGAQLRDFGTYATLGRIASRSELFSAGKHSYTPFDSDPDDLRMDCDHDVFANLLDQGKYVKDGRGIPNVYGPITLVFDSSALRNSGTEEVRVRKTGIWTSDDNGRQVIGTATGVQSLYDYSGRARYGEIQIVGGTLWLKDLEYILVTPVSSKGVALIDIVKAVLAPIEVAMGRHISVCSRSFDDRRARAIYEHLVEWASNAPTNGGAVSTLPDSLRVWFRDLRDRDKLRANLTRFAKYMSHGTISVLEGERGHLNTALSISRPHIAKVDDGVASLLTPDHYQTLTDAQIPCKALGQIRDAASRLRAS